MSIERVSQSALQILQIQTYLRDHGLDGWLLYDFRGTNPIALQMAGLTNSGTRRWFLWLPTAGQPHLLIHAIEGSTFRDAALALQAQVTHYVSWQQLHHLLPQITQNARRMAMEYSPENAIPYVSKVDAGTLEMVVRQTGAEIVSSADLVQLTQAVLSPTQQAGHRRAAHHCMTVKDEAFALVTQKLKAGQEITEFTVQQFILQRFSALDLDPDHPPIVAVNAHAADPHYAPTAQHHSPIQPGDMLLIDLWARELGDPTNCFGDLTWTAYCGRQVPEQVQQIFSVVAQARDAAVNCMQQGLSAGETVYGYAVDDACRAVIQQAGYGDAFIHRTGHSLGSAVHFTGVNLDNLETQDRRSLIPGVLVTVEPGIYLPNLDFDGSGLNRGLGIRSEVNCLVLAQGVEVTALPIQTEVTPLL